MRAVSSFALALAAGYIPVSAMADEATTLSKLDAIEKRLSHIEAMEQARGPRSPFAFTIPTTAASGMGTAYFVQACQSLGYGRYVNVAAPATFQGAPSATTVICYDSRSP